jgi:hypothetical protein
MGRGKDGCKAETDAETVSNTRQRQQASTGRHDAEMRERLDLINEWED